MKTVRSLTVILRGALAGALGGLILLLTTMVWYLVTLGGIPFAHLFIFQGLPLMLVVGALAGASVGGAVLLLRKVTGREFGPMGRGVIGFVTILIALVLIGLFGLSRPEDPDKRRFPRESVSWTRQVFNGVMIEIVLGVLPGLVAHPKRKR